MRKTSRKKDTSLALVLPFLGCVVWVQATLWLRDPSSQGAVGSASPVCSGCTGFSAASAAAKENSYLRGGNVLAGSSRFSFHSDGKWSLPGVGGPRLPSRPQDLGAGTHSSGLIPGRQFLDQRGLLLGVSRHLWSHTFT